MVLTTGALGAEASVNPSSHDAAFFNELMVGRVYVFKEPWRSGKWEWANVARAYYRDAAGNMVGCTPYGVTDGWVQESWPRVAVAWCPDRVPAGMPINERQTAKSLDDMRKQDPDAPIRHFMGVPGTSLGEAWMASIAEAPEAESGPRED